jgi:hypothetical protein
MCNLHQYVEKIYDAATSQAQKFNIGLLWAGLASGAIALA